MFGLGIQELLIFGVIAVLLFGKRLPEVARQLGAGYQDFRKGLGEIQSQMDIRDTIYNSPTSSSLPSATQTNDDRDDFDEPTAPKLELPDTEESSER